MQDRYFNNDCIYALATPFGSSAIAVFRVSGTGSLALLNKMLNRSIELKQGKELHFRTVFDANRIKIDDALVSVFGAGHGYTREESAEISVHGSVAVIRALQSAFESGGFRLAYPGEFTYRALHNGSLSLVQAEAVNELVGSQSDRSRQEALSHLSGLLDEKYREVYDELIAVFSIFELQLDYSEDEYDEDTSYPAERIKAIREKVKSLADSYRSVKKTEDGVKIVLVGETNAGKSTLFNALVRENRSIVSSQKGTTRDYIKEIIEINGVKVSLYDTAGLNEDAEGLENEGIRRTLELEKCADIIIRFLGDGDLSGGQLPSLPNVIYVRNKSDLPGKPALPASVLSISAATGDGIGNLIQRITSMIDVIVGTAGYDCSIGSQRQEQLLRQILAHIDSLDESDDVMVQSAEVHNAILLMQQLLGICDEQGAVLEEIFARFCVGK